MYLLHRISKYKAKTTRAYQCVFTFQNGNLLPPWIGRSWVVSCRFEQLRIGGWIRLEFKSSAIFNHPYRIPPRRIHVFLTRSTLLLQPFYNAQSTVRCLVAVLKDSRSVTLSLALRNHPHTTVVLKLTRHFGTLLRQSLHQWNRENSTQPTN